MLILTTTSETIRIKLAGAATTTELYCTASFRDTSSTAITPDSNMVQSNGTTAVNIVGAPASGDKRLVEDMHVFNGDTASAVVTIEKYNGTSAYPVFITTLGVGEKIEYQSAGGFKVITNSGAIKTSLNQGTSPAQSGDSVVTLSTSVPNSDVTPNTLYEISGLGFPVEAFKTYEFEFRITYSVTVATTGSRWVLKGPAYSFLTIASDYALSATSRTFNNVTAYDLPAACNTASGAVGGNLAIIRGMIKTTAAGNVVPWFASEIAASTVTAESGSTCRYRQVL